MGETNGPDRPSQPGGDDGSRLREMLHGAARGAVGAMAMTGMRVLTSDGRECLNEQLGRWPWAGPAYGLVVWLGFELGIAPALGLSQAKRARLVDGLALAADHLLYGLVLSGTRGGARG